jgi:hypothetical protein
MLRGTARGDGVSRGNFDNERWRIADQTAAFLSVDRDVCRRAFYGEPLALVSEVVQWVRSEEDAPDFDPERMILGWARDVGAGVFDEDRRRGRDLIHVGDIVAGEFLQLAFRRPKFDHNYDYTIFLACVRLEESRVGRQLTPSELDRFTRSFTARSYRRDLESIPQEQWDEFHAELEYEEPRTRLKRPPYRRAI